MLRLFGKALGGLLILVVVIYLVALTGLYVQQLRLLYFPSVAEVTPASVGLANVERLHLKTADGETLLACRLSPPPGAPMIVYLHGIAAEHGSF